MKRRYFLIFCLSAIATLILTMGWRILTYSPSFVQNNTTLLVSAAASLQDALEAIDPIFERSHPDITVNYNFGSSGTLQQQIEQGAPADIFISAATKQMDALQQKELILADTHRNLLTNRLVLIVPINSTLKLNSFRQLSDTKVKRIAVGEFRSVPVGQYAEEMLTKLGILNQVKSKLVYGNSVRNVLAAVESGSADAGIVYATDAKISDRVKQVAIALQELHSPIVYPIAILKESQNLQAAKMYEQFLFTPQGSAIFEKYGFGITLLKAIAF